MNAARRTRDRRGDFSMSRALRLIAATAIALAPCAPGIAHADLIVNGGFETTANVTPPNYPPAFGGGPGQPGAGGTGQLDYNVTATGWSNPTVDYTNQTGYTFIMSPSQTNS